MLNRNLLHRGLLPASASALPVQVVVGVSGGADSVCLLHALHGLAAERRLVIHAAHLDHGLRAESARDAAFVGELAQRLNLPFHHHVLAPGALLEAPGSIEAAARQARYAFLCRVAYGLGDNVNKAEAVPGEARLTAELPLVAVAHNAEDQAETLLLNLVRGSGLRGLGGMRWKRAIRGVYDGEDDSQPRLWLIRPFLNIRRAEIEVYLRSRGLGWREDASNEDTAYTRNHLRHRVLPLLAEINPRVVDALTRTAEVAGDAYERLAQADRTLLNELLLEPAAAIEGQTIDRVVLDLDKLAGLGRPEQRGVLRTAMASLVRDLDDIDFEAVERTLDGACGSRFSSGPHPLAGDLCWSILSAQTDCPRRLSLHLLSSLPLQPPGPHLGGAFGTQRRPVIDGLTVNGWRLHVQTLDRRQLPAHWRTASPWHAWLDADRIGTPQLCAPADGMRLAPLGMDGRTKALGDLFTDAKVPPALRRGWPLIVDARNDAILWVCGLRLAQDACVTGRTTRLLHLWWESALSADL